MAADGHGGRPPPSVFFDLHNKHAQVAYVDLLACRPMPRPSPIRDALRTLFLRPEHRAWSLDELVARVRTLVGSGDYSTVFRAVAVFERDGLIERVDLGDGLARYETRRSHHEHVRCDRCGVVAEVPGCALGAVGKQVEASTGFRLSGHTLVFSGLCPSCSGG